MALVPCFNSLFVAFPAQQEGCISGFPAFQSNLAGTLFAQRAYKVDTVVDLILMDSAYVVRRLLGKLEFVGIGLRINDAEELRHIHLVLCTCSDDRGHFGRC